MDIFFKQLEIGPMANYIYLIGDPASRKMAVVDPAWDVPLILKWVNEAGYELSDILITHGHPDHINGVETLLNQTSARLHMHKDEVPWISGWKETAIDTENGSHIWVGDIDIQCIHTPGHTPGSQCFLVNQKLVSGDTLFIGGCGRTDLPGGNASDLYESLNFRLDKLADETVLCPGHNYAPEKTSTLGRERQSNPFMQYENVKGFIKKRQPDLLKDDPEEA